MTPDLSLRSTRTAPAPQAWPVALAALGFAWLAILLLLRDTAAAMVDLWIRLETFQHAFVVPLISAWLAWRLRHRLAPLQPRPSWGWLAMAVVLAALWWVADMVHVNAATQFALVALLIVAVPTVLGTAVARELAFPLAFLLFCVPVGEFLTPSLMQLTADFTVTALRLSGIPVERQGLEFVIPSGRWSVVEACSGIRYLIASLMVGTLFAYLNYRHWRKRLAFVAVAAAVPIVANWLRAYMIVMIGHLSDNRLAAGVDHLIYGWVFFGVVVMAMFFIGMRWADSTDADLQPSAVPSRGGVGEGSRAPRGSVPPSSWVMACVLTVSAVAWPSLANWAVRERAAQPAVPPSLPTELRGGWQGTALSPALGWQPLAPGAAPRQRQAYMKDGSVVELVVDHFRQQSRDVKLVSSSNTFLSSTDAYWRQDPIAAVELGAEVRAAKAVALVARQSFGSGRLIAVRVYWVDGGWETGDVRAKLRGVRQKLTSTDDSAAIVWLVTGSIGDDAADVARLRAFWSDASPSLDRWLDDRRASP